MWKDQKLPLGQQNSEKTPSYLLRPPHLLFQHIYPLICSCDANPEDHRVNWNSYIDGNINNYTKYYSSWTIILLICIIVFSKNRMGLCIRYSVLLLDSKFNSFSNKMVTKFMGFDGLNGIKSTLQNFMGTSLHFYDMQKI